MCIGMARINDSARWHVLQINGVDNKLHRNSKDGKSPRAGVIRDRVMEEMRLELGLNKRRTWVTGRILKLNKQGEQQKY